MNPNIKLYRDAADHGIHTTSVVVAVARTFTNLSVKGVSIPDHRIYALKGDVTGVDKYMGMLLGTMDSVIEKARAITRTDPYKAISVGSLSAINDLDDVNIELGVIGTMELLFNKMHEEHLDEMRNYAKRLKCSDNGCKCSNDDAGFHVGPMNDDNRYDDIFNNYNVFKGLASLDYAAVYDYLVNEYDIPRYVIEKTQDFSEELVDGIIAMLTEDEDAEAE